MVGLWVSLITLNTYADSLPEVVSTVLDTNPGVKERLKNYHAKKAEIGIAQAEYYPTVNLQSAVGKKLTGRFDTNAIHESYTIFQNSLILKQNIFNGFGTNEQVNYKKMQALAAAYSYLDKANDIALDTIKAYIGLQQQIALLKNSQNNVAHHQSTYRKIQKAYDAGLTTLSEVSKIRSALSLSKSNLMLQQNKLLNAQSTFRKIVGNRIDLKKLNRVDFSVKLPHTEKKAETYALAYSPSVLTGKYNVKGAKALYEKSKSSFYPKVDIELSQNYNDNYNEFIGKDDRTQGLLVVSYNLYNGGTDEANKLSTLHKMNQEASIVNDIKRQVIERVTLAWNAYRLSLEQIPFLKQYKAQSQKTLSLYHKEYDVGNRTLLDIISVENDLKRANDELIYTRYNLLQSKYEIMHAMGLTIASVLGNQSDYYRRVGISRNKKIKTAKTDSIYTELKRAMQTDKRQEEILNQRRLEEKKAQTDRQIPRQEDIPQKDKSNTDKQSSGMSTFFDELKKIRWESR